jgi:hypothetical protein
MILYVEARVVDQQQQLIGDNQTAVIKKIDKV